MSIHKKYEVKHLQYRGGVKPEKTMGEGDECVYVYYDPARKALAKKRSQVIWPCKIGLAKGEAEGRIITQGVGVAFCAVPVVPLAFQTDDSKNLEGALHASLAYAGRHIKNAIGTEWFQTNPKEIEVLYRAIERMKTLIQQAPKR